MRQWWKKKRGYTRSGAESYRAEGTPEERKARINTLRRKNAEKWEEDIGPANTTNEDIHRETLKKRDEESERDLAVKAYIATKARIDKDRKSEAVLDEATNELEQEKKEEEKREELAEARMNAMVREQRKDNKIEKWKERVKDGGKKEMEREEENEQEGKRMMRWEEVPARWSGARTSNKKQRKRPLSPREIERRKASWIVHETTVAAAKAAKLAAAAAARSSSSTETYGSSSSTAEKTEKGWEAESIQPGRDVRGELRRRKGTEGEEELLGCLFDARGRSLAEGRVDEKEGTQSRKNRRAERKESERKKRKEYEREEAIHQLKEELAQLQAEKEERKKKEGTKEEKVGMQEGIDYNDI